jgi:hypothetical protein
MNTLEYVSGASVRDPIAVSIEGFLHREAARGHGQLKMNQEDDGVRVRFANATARGENYDIAFVRLARALLEDDRYSVALTAALREPISVAEIRSNQALAYC